jgi:hypothetical protein
MEMWIKPGDDNDWFDNDDNDFDLPDPDDDGRDED